MVLNNLNYIDYIYLSFLVLFTIFFALKGATKSINYSLKILLSVSIPFLFYKRSSNYILTELDIQFFNNLADSLIISSFNPFHPACKTPKILSF